MGRSGHVPAVVMAAVADRWQSPRTGGTSVANVSQRDQLSAALLLPLATGTGPGGSLDGHSSLGSETRRGSGAARELSRQ